MTYKIQEIEGIGPTYGAKLAATGITTTDKLLEKCATARGRREISLKTGLPASALLRWANMADLMRISGVGEEYSELLEAVGVDTVKELKYRNPANLASRIQAVNQAKKLTRRVPTEAQISKWVEQAKSLPPVVSY